MTLAEVTEKLALLEARILELEESIEAPIKKTALDLQYHVHRYGNFGELKTSGPERL
jgi:hypothetical protein